MAREIQLDGAEISVIKALGIGSGDMDGRSLMARCGDLDFAELMDCLKSLMALGYVDGDDESFQSQDELEKLHFRVNPGYAKELRDALDPRPEPKASKRVRRE